MKTLWTRVAVCSVFVLLLASLAARSAEALPDYAPAPPDNPLKGFAPYAGQAREFPHSLEFNYLPVGAVMKGPDEFDWQPLERLLGDVASRGCQTVFRFYLEYPNKPVGVPQFLLDAGVRIYTNMVGEAGLPEQMLTPDYEDSRLRAALMHFVGVLGARYDGDARIGFITAGLLGKWGEWHDFPLNQLWASQTVQRELMEAYASAFKRTPILLRYPAAEADPAYAANHMQIFGYHDDSFAWATMPTERQSDNWFFLARMQRSGAEAMNKWRAHPIGGEVRPEVWRGLWDEPPSTPPGQEFLRCVEATHATWLMDSSIAHPLTASQRERAMTGARQLGYEFYVASTGLQMDATRRVLNVCVTLRNLGVAPFYADWPVELGALDAQGKLVATWKPGWRLPGLLPNDADRRWEYAANTQQVATGRYHLLLRVPNPMPNGRPLRFANRAQSQHLPDWLTLGEFKP